MKTKSEDRWLSVEEIADYLGVKGDTVYKWIDRKKMPAHMLGSLWKFKRDEVDTWVRNGRQLNRDNSPLLIETGSRAAIQTDTIACEGEFRWMAMMHLKLAGSARSSGYGDY